MEKRYVDANILEDLARNAGRTRDDLDSLLRMCEARVAAVPSRGWDQGAWWDVRNTLRLELGLLDNDDRALLNRAGRVRVVAAERALLEWLEDHLMRPLYIYSGQLFSDGLKAVAKLSEGERARLISMLFKLEGVLVRGAMWEEPVLLGTQLGKVVGVTTAGVLTVVSSAVQNWVLYGKESVGKVVAATAIDSAILVPYAVVGAIGVTAILGCAATAPVWLVVAGVGIVTVTTVVLTDWVGDRLRSESWYKATIDSAGKAIDQRAQRLADLGGQALDTAGKVVDGAVDTAAGMASSAGRAVDGALDSAIEKVAKPLDTIESWFAPKPRKVPAAIY